ncbi:hypothetical protein B0H11DRAFT_1898416 [Mycena galericulata]|nr:hypothetical protein B0H11DRAFT_1898416 [Mycena galericulata]
MAPLWSVVLPRVLLSTSSVLTPKPTRTMHAAMHIKTEAVGATDTKTPTEMTRAAGYISPLSSLEDVKSTEVATSKTHIIAVKSIYLFRGFVPRSLEIRREMYQIRPAESKSENIRAEYRGHAHCRGHALKSPGEDMDTTYNDPVCNGTSVSTDDGGIVRAVQHREWVVQGEQFIYPGLRAICYEGPCVGERDVESREEEKDDHAAQMKFVMGFSM